MEQLKYYGCRVALYNDKNYTCFIKLSDFTYHLAFRYNTFAGAYMLTVYDANGNTLISNKMVKPDRMFDIKPRENSVESLNLVFNKIFPNADVNYDKWDDNMMCTAYLTRWENVEQ